MEPTTTTQATDEELAAQAHTRLILTGRSDIPTMVSIEDLAEGDETVHGTVAEIDDRPWYPAEVDDHHVPGVRVTFADGSSIDVAAQGGEIEVPA